MNPTDSSSMYVILVLPSMFGLTLMGEGVWKVVHQRMVGFLNILLGMLFMLAVGVGYLMFLEVI